MTEELFKTMVRLRPEVRDKLFDDVLARRKRGLAKKEGGSNQAVISDAIEQFEEKRIRPIKIQKREE